MTRRFNRACKYYKSIAVFSPLMVLAFCACSKKGRVSDWSTVPPTAAKIAETNKVRREYGIRQIKEDWIFYGREFGVEKWKDGKLLCKTVCCDDRDRRPITESDNAEGKDGRYRYETVLYETDYYYTARSYPSRDPDGGNDSEVLTVTYDYGQRRFGIAYVTDNVQIQAEIKGLTGMLKRPERYGPVVLGYMGRTNAETLQLADRILEMWGMSRL